MITLKDLEGALCAGMDPGLWDPDSHHHLYLGANSCWICLEASEICFTCPVWEACYQQAVEIRESHTIRAGMLWTNGRGRHINKRRS